MALGETRPGVGLTASRRPRESPLGRSGGVRGRGAAEGVSEAVDALQT